VAHALSQLLHTLVLTTAPRRILVGGGVVAARPTLLEQVRQQLCTSLNAYLDLDRLTGGLDRYIVPPWLGFARGPVGGPGSGTRRDGELKYG
jgi:fructokinase